MAGVKKNFAYQSIYQITTIVLPLITSPYVARVLGASGVGTYSYTYSIAHYFSLFALLGISTHGNRVVAMNRDDPEKLSRTFSELMIVHCAVSFLAVALYYSYVALFGGADKIYLYIQGLWVISSLLDVSWFYFGLEQFKMTVIRSTAIKILSTIAVFLFVKTSDDVAVYCFILAFGTALSQLILWPFLRRNVKFSAVSWEGIRSHIKPLLVLFIPSIAVSLYKYMDKIMLGAMTVKAEVGFYENAERAINIPVSIINSFGVVMLPKMSNMLVKGQAEKGKQYIGASMELIMCLTSAMAFGMCAVADNFSQIFWGIEFAESGAIIKLLTITIFFTSFANVLRMQYLIPVGKNSIFVYSVCIGAVINLIANYFAIPRMASYGAAIGTILAEIAVCVVQCIGCRKDLDIKNYIRKSVPFLLIGLIMFLAVGCIGSFIGSRMVALLAQVATGVFVYCGLALIYFLKTKNIYVIGMIKSVFNKYYRIRHKEQ